MKITQFPILLTIPLFSAALTGCNSDGQLGANGLVRFSQVVDFKETDDFTAPIAENKTVMVALQHPDNSDTEGLIDPDTYPELNLTVEASNPLTSGQTFPLGFAQYAVVLDGSGDFRLRANNGEDELDYLEVVAKPIEDIRLSAEAVVTTKTDECSSSSTESLDDFVLHANQSLTVYVVPVDDAGAPMLGLLHLSASGEGALGLDAPLAGHGASANALQIYPKETELPENETITIEEISEELTIELALKLSNEDQELDCD